MSLNGTLETFALPDVLALLSGTKKTGELQVNGGRGDARVWLDKGQMVGADVPRATTFVDALFEMLRLTSGNFAFENDRQPADPSAPEAVEPLLLEAQSRLAEWKSIEAVVPSLACAVTLAAEVSGAEVTITAEQWRTLVAVATNSDVEGVMSTLGLGEFDTCRMLKDLVQIGLVSVHDAPPAEAKAAAQAPPPAAKEAEPAPEPAAATVEEELEPEQHAFRTPVRASSAFKPPAPSLPPRGVSVSTLLGAARGQGEEDEPEVKGPAHSARSAAPAASTERGPEIRTGTGTGSDAAKPAAAQAPTPAAAAAPAAAKAPAKAANAPGPAPDQDHDDQDASELVHQLAQLQNDTPSPAPRPAAELAADAAETGEAGDAGADEAEAEEPLNRGLLLKFLNSVRS